MPGGDCATGGNFPPHPKSCGTQVSFKNLQLGKSPPFIASLLVSEPRERAALPIVRWPCLTPGCLPAA